MPVEMRKVLGEATNYEILSGLGDKENFSFQIV